MSEEYSFDPWTEFGTGLWDGGRVKITDAYVGFNAEVNNGQDCLVTLEGVDQESGEDWAQWFRVGQGWEGDVKGKRLVAADGAKHGGKLNGNTAYARLIKGLLESGSAAGVDKELRKKGTPFDVKDLWTGMVVDMKRESFKFTGRDNVEVEATRLVIVGVEDVGGNGAKAPAGKAPNPNIVKSGGATPSGGAAGAGDAKLKVQIKALAASCVAEGLDYGTFAEMAYGLPGVMGNAAAEEMVGDVAVWEEAGGTM